MHIEKTNNTNKLMQISYHFALTKIQKLQNFKNNNNKKKTFFLYWPVRSVLPEIDRYGRYFFRYETGEVNHTGLLPGTVYTDHTGRYGTVLTPLIQIPNSFVV